MAGVIQFREAAQTGEVDIQRADILIVCIERVDAEHVREKFPFGRQVPTAVVLGKNPLLREARQDAEVYFVANGSGEAGGKDFADWLGKPIFCCIGGVQGLDGAALIKSFETAKEIKPDERTTAKTSAEPVTKAAGGPERHCAKPPIERFLQDAPHRQERAQKSLPPRVDVATALKEPIVFPPTLIDGLLHQGNKLVLGGGSKSFKTWSLIDITVSIATGVNWWGFPVTKGKVCYINFEIQAAFFFERMRRVAEARGIEIEPGAISAWNLRGYAASAGNIIPQLALELAGQGFALIVLDPIYKLNAGGDENSAGDVTDLMNHVEGLTVKTDAAVVIGAHFSKGNQSEKISIDRISGSGVWARDPDTILTLTEHETPDCFTVESRIRNFAPVPAFVVRWGYPLMVRDDILDPAALKKANSGPGNGQKSKTADDLFELVPPLEPIGKNALLNTANQARENGGLGIGQSKARAFLKELIEKGRLFEFDGPKRSRTNPEIFVSRHAPLT